MPDTLTILQDRLHTAFAQAVQSAFLQVAQEAGVELDKIDPLLAVAGDPKHGDYQANGCMKLAKQLKTNPRQLASAVIEALTVEDICSEVQIAGPGFINLRLQQEFLESQLIELAGDDRLGVPEQASQRVVVDYSSPNAAKEMHIGHVRSTVIGDCIVRVLAFLGHDVIRQNHIGDWGTQFGMLLEFLIESGQADRTDMSIGDLNKLYQQSKKRFDEDEDFARRARERVVKLQGGDEQSLTVWRKLIEESIHHMDALYRQLDVLLEPGDVVGESFYNDRLADTIEELKKVGQIVESDGALIVEPKGFTNAEGEQAGMIVRKRDGGYLYATTDLAAALYRIREVKADRVVYVTDARQADHFGMFFQVLRQSGLGPESVRLDYVPFGTILGSDRKPFKTRDGGTVNLAEVLTEAEQRASAIIQGKNADLPEEERKKLAHAIGIGAIKYFDLSSDRIKDYVFDWDRMLAFDGNTAPYLQNAYVRIQSIFRKGEVNPQALAGIAPAVAEPAERLLSLKLLQFGSVVRTVADTLEPHRLCNYLYETATLFHKFYETCPVLIAETEPIKQARLSLCFATARTLKAGLALLGIQVVERM